MTWIDRLGVGVSLALVLCLPADARSKLDPPELGNYVRWGPFRVRPGLVLSNVGYDDNILGSSSNPIGDYTATVSAKKTDAILVESRKLSAHSA